MADDLRAAAEAVLELWDRVEIAPHPAAGDEASEAFDALRVALEGDDAPVRPVDDHTDDAVGSTGRALRLDPEVIEAARGPNADRFEGLVADLVRDGVRRELERIGAQERGTREREPRPPTRNRERTREGATTDTPDDERLHAGRVMDAYLETIVALMAIRAPRVRDAIKDGLPPEFVLPSSYDGESLIIPVPGMLESMEAEGMDNIQTLRHSVRQANWMLLNAMWEILTQHPRFKDHLEPEPMVRFLRLVRNASSHGGRLDEFKTLEYGPAQWRDKEITQSMRGMRVFPDVLRDGDPVLLVLDIEREFGARAG